MVSSDYQIDFADLNSASSKNKANSNLFNVAAYRERVRTSKMVARFKLEGLAPSGTVGSIAITAGYCMIGNSIVRCEGASAQSLTANQYFYVTTLGVLAKTDTTTLPLTSCTGFPICMNSGGTLLDIQVKFDWYSQQFLGNHKIIGNDEITGSLTLGGNSLVGGTLGVTGLATFTNKIQINDITPSTDKDTGALIVEGGVGVEGAINAGGAVKASNIASGASISGVNTVDATIGDFGSTPDAKGMSVSGQAISLQPTDMTHPGAITTGTQFIAGEKTFTGKIKTSGGAASSSVATGDIVASGGIGVGGAGWFGGLGNFGGSLTVASTLSALGISTAGASRVSLGTHVVVITSLEEWEGLALTSGYIYILGSFTSTLAKAINVQVTIVGAGKDITSVKLSSIYAGCFISGVKITPSTSISIGTNTTFDRCEFTMGANVLTISGNYCTIMNSNITSSACALNGSWYNAIYISGTFTSITHCTFVFTYTNTVNYNAAINITGTNVSICYCSIEATVSLATYGQFTAINTTGAHCTTEHNYIHVNTGASTHAESGAFEASTTSNVNFNFNRILIDAGEWKFAYRYRTGTGYYNKILGNYTDAPYLFVDSGSTGTFVAYNSPWA